MDNLVKALQEKCSTAKERAEALRAEKKQAFLDGVARHVQESCPNAGGAGTVRAWEDVERAQLRILEKHSKISRPVREFPGHDKIMRELAVELEDVGAVTTAEYHDQIMYATIDYVTELRKRDLESRRFYL